MPFTIWTRQDEKPIDSDSWEVKVDEGSGTVTFPRTPSAGSKELTITIRHLLGYRTDGLVENQRVELLNAKGQTFFVMAYSSKPPKVITIGGFRFYEFVGTNGERLSLFAQDGTVAIGDPKTAAP